MRKIMLVCGLFVSFSVSAGQLTGKVTMIQAGNGVTAEGVYAFVKFSNNPSGSTNTCISDTSGRMALNPGTAAGKTILSLLMQAKATNQTVEVVGTNACDVEGSLEDISYIKVLEN